MSRGKSSDTQSESNPSLPTATGSRAIASLPRPLLHVRRPSCAALPDRRANLHISQGKKTGPSNQHPPAAPSQSDRVTVQSTSSTPSVPLKGGVKVCQCEGASIGSV